MLGLKVVLRAALAVVAIGIDEQHLALAGGRLRALGSQDQDTSRYARAVEKLRPQTNYGFDHVIVKERSADIALLAAPEEHAVRHNSRDEAARPSDCQHVLDEHQVGLLALLGRPTATESLRERHLLTGVVHGERRIGNHPIEPHQLATLDMGRIFKGAIVGVANVSVGDAMQEQVHLADSPDTPVLLLACEGEVATVAAGLLDVFLRQDEHSAGP